ncbi:MAG: hypothetical protein FJ290_14765 [Planctomycetes bacterium]|nr:hypothetical protein [Planctomycetota bacterium]
MSLRDDVEPVAEGNAAKEPAGSLVGKKDLQRVFDRLEQSAPELAERIAERLRLPLPEKSEPATKAPETSVEWFGREAVVERFGREAQAFADREIERWPEHFKRRGIVPALENLPTIVLASMAKAYGQCIPEKFLGDLCGVLEVWVVLVRRIADSEQCAWASPRYKKAYSLLRDARGMFDSLPPLPPWCPDPINGLRDLSEWFSTLGVEGGDKGSKGGAVGQTLRQIFKERRNGKNSWYGRTFRTIQNWALTDTGFPLPLYRAARGSGKAHLYNGDEVAAYVGERAQK